MEDTKKETEIMCTYEREGYKCNRPRYDDEYCVFHSTAVDKSKRRKFDTAFKKEYKKCKTNDILTFTGFVFPDSYKLVGINLQRADLQSAKLVGADLKGAVLQGAKLQNADLENADLSGANLQKAELQETNLQNANLQEANLNHANLEKAKLIQAKLQDASIKWSILDGAELHKAELDNARLRGTSLRGADLQDANLEAAELDGADLQGAKFWRTSLQKTNLKEAKLQGANLKEAQMEKADLSSANLEKADLKFSSFEKATVTKVKFDKETQCLGIDVTQAKGSPYFVRFAKDQEYLEELKSKKCGKVICFIWSLFAGCGRSLSRWILWSVGFALYFALNYHWIFLTYSGSFNFNNEILNKSFWSFLYYSVVTFTTLGFGDIIPTTGWAQGWVMAEVILGYIMLGGLISIFANKLARRS